jgi:hypothetical protein
MGLWIRRVLVRSQEGQLEERKLKPGTRFGGAGLLRFCSSSASFWRISQLLVAVRRAPAA